MEPEFLANVGIEQLIVLLAFLGALSAAFMLWFVSRKQSEEDDIDGE